MSKTASIYTRIDPVLKEQVEQILSTLGIPVANAINIFLHQIVLHKGIPFDVKIPQNSPLLYNTLTKEQFDIEIEKGMDDVKSGKTISSKQVREDMQSQYKT